MESKYSDTIKVTNIGTQLGLCCTLKARTEVTYKGRVYGELSILLESYKIPMSAYTKVQNEGYSTEVTLLYLLGDLKSIDSNLSKSIDRLWRC